MMNRSPANPRLSLLWPEAARFRRHVEIQNVAGIVAIEEKHAAAAVDGFCGAHNRGGGGEANTLPATLPSAMPRPTKPANIGS